MINRLKPITHLCILLVIAAVIMMNINLINPFTLNRTNDIKPPSSSAEYVDEKLYFDDVLIKLDILSLMAAYPEHITNVEKTDNAIYVVLKSGKKIIYHDSNTMRGIENPYIKYMLSDKYPLDNIDKLQEYDPGRARIYTLLSEVYGGTQESIVRNLLSVNLGGRNYYFNAKNNAAKNLKSAFMEVLSLTQKYSSISSRLYPLGGTYNYRLIAGTGRLSAHSYGIAIDLVVDNREYWKWNTAEGGLERIFNYPQIITEVFEKYGFIWGGKWKHFDLMHYEYRPEIILNAQFTKKIPNTNEPWYKYAVQEWEKSEREGILDAYIEMLDKL